MGAPSGPLGRGWPLLAVAPLALLAAACLGPPGPPPAPTCYPQPQATGEKVIGLTLEAPPATQVEAGQALTLTISGRYVIPNVAIVCGDEIARYRHADDFPEWSWDRPVHIALDGQPLATFTCGYTCPISVTIPASTAPGPHSLEVVPYVLLEVTVLAPAAP